MTTPLRALIIEDVEEDGELLIRELERGGYDPTWERVETAEAMQKALAEKAWDIVFCDYNMPRFSGPEALSLFKQTGLTTPFILVSGTIGEGEAVDMVKIGADDFLLKGRWTRLSSIVERELRRAAAEVRRQTPLSAAKRVGWAARFPIPAGRLPLLFFIAGILLMCLAALWRFIMFPSWNVRLTPDWRWQGQYIGIITEPEPATGRFPSRDKVGLYERAARVLGPAPGEEAVIVEDRFTIRDPAAGKPTWEYILRSAVNPRTGRHAAAAHSGDQFVFPRDTRKSGYRIRFNYLEGVPVAFHGEETVEGIPVYVFTYRGRAEYTRCYAGTPDYPGAKVKQGQDIRCAADQFSIRFWVEPLTGEILKLDEGCPSGDWIYDVASGKALQPLLRWGGVNTGDDLLLRAAFIRGERRRLLWMGLCLPAGLLMAGLGLTAAALALHARRSGRFFGGA